MFSREYVEFLNLLLSLQGRHAQNTLRTAQNSIIFDGRALQKLQKTLKCGKLKEPLDIEPGSLQDEASQTLYETRPPHIIKQYCFYISQHFGNPKVFKISGTIGHHKFEKCFYFFFVF